MADRSPELAFLRGAGQSGGAVNGEDDVPDGRVTGTPVPGVPAEPDATGPADQADAAAKAEEADPEEADPEEADPEEADPEEADAAGADAAGAEPGAPRRKLWWQRPTIRTLCREGIRDRESARRHDDMWNERSRLPDGESVQLGGAVLAEAFTPSTVAGLYAALDRLPLQDGFATTEWRERLSRSRTGIVGGWQNLGVVRRPGQLVLGTGYTDPDLPDGVSAVWLHLNYEMPSVAVVVATFCFEEDAGDLSELLRAPRRQVYFDPRVTVEGRFGQVRARIPWARPARYRLSYQGSHVDEQKRQDCENRMGELEDACWTWFTRRFPGRFRDAPADQRPRVRLMFTSGLAPLTDAHPALGPVGLNQPISVWRDGAWTLSDHHPRRYDHGPEHLLTIAGRRQDLARQEAFEADGSNWSLVAVFAADQSTLASRYAVHALLDVYAARLALLRDAAGTRRRMRRPVTEARVLDGYLSRDGLDVATVAADTKARTAEPVPFLFDVPAYAQDLARRPGPPDAGGQPAQFANALREEIQRQAARLETDIDATTRNIRASAELRQAIANTRLQRFVLLISVIALAVAVLSAAG